jgi:hypothetical protein
MDSLYAFKCLRFRNIRHTVTVVKLLLKYPALPLEVSFYIVSSETASRPNKRLVRTYH